MIRQTALHTAVVALVLAMTPPAMAETPLFAMGFGDDVVQAHAGDILSAQPSFDVNNQPALSIRLDPRFDVMIDALTARHIGDRGYLKVCGETLLEPILQTRIHTAEIFITAVEMEEATRLAALLNSSGCGSAPES